MKAVVVHEQNRFARQGLLDLDRMVTRTYTLDEAPQAFEDLQAGVNARGVIVVD